MGLVLVLCFGTAYTVANADGMILVSYWQLQKPYFGILLGILTALVAMALLGYKSLILQMRLATLGAIVALGMQGWLVILPLAICVFNFLGARSCFQDQLMVESAYRVRERRRRNAKSQK